LFPFFFQSTFSSFPDPLVAYVTQAVEENITFEVEQETWEIEAAKPQVAATVAEEVTLAMPIEAEFERTRIEPIEIELEEKKSPPDEPQHSESQVEPKTTTTTNAAIAQTPLKACKHKCKNRVVCKHACCKY
jgi:hypothetical protein